MIITPENIFRHELIGLPVEVAESTNLCLAGISGKVVDETRNMLLIETRKGTKHIFKSHTCFVFTLPQRRRVNVEGSVLVSRPENRIYKKVRRLRWKL
ncbi:MAG: ribonuclease P protein component 1 [Methanotrichaceae archaeon]